MAVGTAMVAPTVVTGRVEATAVVGGAVVIRSESEERNEHNHN